eukprot:Nk52_evm94s151 gene=Nk52_evmTU94s151
MTISKLQVRKATLEDLDTLVEGIATMAKDSEGIDLDLKILREGVKAPLADNSKGVYYLAEAPHENMDGKMRFAGCLMVFKEWSDWKNGEYWWIASVQVEKWCRKQGVFRAMFEYVSGLAKADPNVYSVRLYVERENTVAREVYSKVGIPLSHYDMHEMDA